MELELITTIIGSLGPAAAAFGIMYLWLRAVRQELEEEQEHHRLTRERMETLQSDRVAEMQKQVELLQAFRDLISADKSNTRGYSPRSHDSPPN